MSELGKPSCGLLDAFTIVHSVSNLSSPYIVQRGVIQYNTICMPPRPCCVLVWKCRVGVENPAARRTRGLDVIYRGLIIIRIGFGVALTL